MTIARKSFYKPENIFKQVKKKINEAIKSIKKREETNRERWIKYYNYDFKNKKNYDLIIDTTNIKPEEVVKKILDYIKAKTI